ncbi:hypothetical protein CHISP_1279 [Chitinispirillum alkaliphilum]|nr:hypothetical protein CHISP_1279 [Chitinispirillum alkaliphilum]
MQPVPARILWYWTPGIPIYIYVTVAFGVGLLLGFAASAYYYLVGQFGLRRKNQLIKELDAELYQVKSELEVLKSAEGSSKAEDSGNDFSQNIKRSEDNNGASDVSNDTSKE